VYKISVHYQRVQVWAIGLLLLAISLSFTASFIHPFVTAKHISLRLGVALLLLFIPLGLKSIKWRSIDGLLLAWFIWQGMSTLMDTPWPQSGFKLEGLLLLILFYLMMRTTLRNRTYINSIVQIIVVVATLQSCIGILQYFKLFPWTSAYFLGYESQVTGTVGGANVLAALLAMSLPAAYFLVGKSTKTEKVGWVVALILIVITLILTRSRGAWLATIVGIGIYKWSLISEFLRVLKPRKIITSIFFLFAIGAMTLFLFLIYDLNPDSANGRLFIWAITWDMISDHLLRGVGQGNFGLNWLEYQGAYFENAAESSYKLAVNLTSAHSQYLHVMAETGIVGLGFLLAIVLWILFSFKMWLSRSNRSQHRGPMVLFVSLATLSIHALVEDVFSSLPVQLLFLLVLPAYFSGIATARDSTKIRVNRFSGWTRFSFIFLFITLLAISWYQVKGELLWKQGQNHAGAGKWEQGTQCYREAMVYLPHNNELEFYIGAAYAKTGQAEKAIKFLKKSQEGFSDKNQYIALGKAYIDDKDYDNAESALKQALYYYPVLLYPHYWLSRVYYELGDIKNAKQELEIILSAKNILDSPDIERVKEDARRTLKALDKAILPQE